MMKISDKDLMLDKIFFSIEEGKEARHCPGRARTVEKRTPASFSKVRMGPDQLGIWVRPDRRKSERSEDFLG